MERSPFKMHGICVAAYLFQPQQTENKAFHFVNQLQFRFTVAFLPIAAVYFHIQTQRGKRCFKLMRNIGNKLGVLSQRARCVVFFEQKQAFQITHGIVQHGKRFVRCGKAKLLTILYKCIDLPAQPLHIAVYLSYIKCHDKRNNPSRRGGKTKKQLPYAHAFSSQR